MLNYCCKALYVSYMYSTKVETAFEKFESLTSPDIKFDEIVKFDVSIWEVM